MKVCRSCIGWNSQTLFTTLSQRREKNKREKKNTTLEKSSVGELLDYAWAEGAGAFSSAFLNCLLNKITVKDTAKKSAIGSAKYTAKV